jgi:hypothetical protein
MAEVTQHISFRGGLDFATDISQMGDVSECRNGYAGVLPKLQDGAVDETQEIPYAETLSRGVDRSGIGCCCVSCRHYLNILSD